MYVIRGWLFCKIWGLLHYFMFVIGNFQEMEYIFLLAR